MNQVTKPIQAEVAPPATPLDAIIRAASDPGTDADKMERLFVIYERMQAHNARLAYVSALSAAQGEFPVIEKSGDGDRGKWKYAKWEDAVSAITPVLSRHGLSLTFHPRNEDGALIVMAKLSHAEGHSETADSPKLSADTSGSKNAPQSLVSSLSYGKRAAAFALLNIAAKNEDDDGKGAGAALITEQQFIHLRDLITESGANEQKFLEHIGETDLHTVPQAKYQSAVSSLKRKISQKGGQ